MVLRLKLSTVWMAAGITCAVLLSGCADSNYDPTKNWSVDKLFSEAKDEMAAGGYEKAIGLYEKLEGRAAGTPLAQQAQLDKAWAQYKTNEPVQAVATLDRFIKLHPASPALDYALYLKGLVNFNDNLGWFSNLAEQDLAERDPKQAKESFEAFRELVVRFPDSKYAEDARLRMTFIKNSLARSDVHVARYYYQRGAYLAAANRAQLVIRDYDRAPAVEEALYILTKSYEKLGMTQLSNDSARVFKLNFPDSEMMLTGQRVKKQRSWWQFWNK